MTHGKLFGGCAVAALFTWAAPARAQDQAPFRPADYTDVIDAFDGEDPFDLNLGIGYTRTMKKGRIRREVAGDAVISSETGQPISDDGFIDYLDVADYTQLTHTLNLEMSVGLYHDLALWTRWPLVLSDNRDLDFVSGTDFGGVREHGLSCPNATSSSSATDPGCNFDLPFKSPERSGVDSFGLGLDWGLLDQGRDRTKPTFVIGVEAWFAVGDPLVADREGPPVNFAGAPSNYNRGVADKDAGISRGVTKLAASFRYSHRFRYVEPYAGLRASGEFPTSDSPYPQVDDPGRLNTVPPIIGGFLGGLEVVPWENPDQFQRFAVDVRLSGEFHSEGRDYSELFDALGTTTSTRLLQPEAAMSGREARNDPNNEWTGQTDVQNYGIFTGRLALNLQAAQYIRFNLGVGYGFVQEHSLTVTDACNPDANVDIAHIPCTEGAPNPDHRPEVDLPGRRYRIEEETIFDAFVAATAMF